MSNIKERLVAMDVMRGFALLGILMMNIQSFAMPGAAYLNPMAFGDFAGINQAVWVFSHLFADQKFMTLFSMLFGAGVLLFCEKASEKGVSAGRLHYKRNLWLLVFGLMHGYFFWYGDILFSYAMCGFIVYLFRNRSIKTLVSSALLLMLLSSLYSVWMGLSISHFPTDALRGMKEAWAPDEANIAKEIAAYLGGFTSALAYRAEETAFMQTYVFLTTFIWRATAMMLLGMALYKSGFFHLTWQKSSYQKLILITFPIGAGLVLTGLQQHFSHDFALQYSMFIGNQFNYWGSVLMGLSYAALIMLLVNGGRLQSFQARLAAIGKTAFSQYILQTLVFTTLFYGYGLGLFAETARWQQCIMVLAMWLFQLWLAPSWLAKFRFGPLEWLWRSLTYGRLQPFML